VYRATGTPIHATLVLAHGAGAGQRSAFVSGFAAAIAGRGVDVMTFDFLYMHARRRMPDRPALLEACWRAAIDTARAEIDTARRALFIGGKSMGGRIASQVAAADPDLPVAGLVLLGYPLHPPGRPEQRRDRHLPEIRCPLLFVQGSRDAFGTPDELAPVLRALNAPATLHVVDGGDHSFKVTPGGRARQAAVDEEIVRISEEWMRAVLRRKDGGC
jgi:predicted alpha/beta-hydrolase family hydrolase